MDEKSGVKKIFICANKWLIFAQKNAKNKKNAIIYKIICTGQKKAVSLPRKLKKRSREAYKSETTGQWSARLSRLPWGQNRQVCGMYVKEV